MAESAAQCMFRAYDALVGAAERFAGEDGDYARRARNLAREVEAEDPALQERVWDALPDEDEPARRVGEIAEAADVDDWLIYHVLEALRRRRRAGQRGGWWRRRVALREEHRG